MGNSAPTGLRLGINADHSCQVPLGGSASLHFSGRETTQYSNDDILILWRMSYKVGNSTRNLSLFQCKRNLIHPTYHYYNNINVNIYAGEESYVWGVERAEADLLRVHSPFDWDSRGEGIRVITVPPGNRFLTANAQGGITETVFYVYRRETGTDLIVTELKKKGRAEKPYMATLTHYYANPHNGNDVGFSAALKRITVSSDGSRLDFAVDGPHRHPVHALLYMFDEVLRTGTWNPTCCPHCADNYIIQRLRGMSSQSEDEDSDMDNVVPEASLHGRRQNAVGTILANNGRFWGNRNGNLIIRNPRNIRNLYVR